MNSMIRQPRILQKFYVYDPNVPDLLGGLRVLQDTDDKGNVKDGTKHVLAVTQQVQWWIDQGLLGEKPVGEISESHKKLLAQITRGRSEDNDAVPPRVARLDKRIQSGAPRFAGAPSYKKAPPKKKNGKNGNGKKPETKPASTTSPPKA